MSNFGSAAWVDALDPHWTDVAVGVGVVTLALVVDVAVALDDVMVALESS